MTVTDAGVKLCDHCGGHAQYCHHVARPAEDYMTISEVAKVVGLPRRTVAHHVQFGKLPAYMAPGIYKNTKTWIKRADVTAYAQALMKDKPERMLKWAANAREI